MTNIQAERDHKIRVFREQVAHCTGKLQRTTGMLQFSIEVLKESDPAAFLQVGINCNDFWLWFHTGRTIAELPCFELYRV